VPVSNLQDEAEDGMMDLQRQARAGHAERCLIAPNLSSLC
jgi:uncharacterized protein YfcZ (UPF0381/DUF406 family)